MDARRVCLAMLGIGASLLLIRPLEASAAPAWQFHLEEATIADVHRVIRAKQITAVQLVNLYFKRIEACNGTCVKGDIDPATGLMLGELTKIDNDPNLPDALEVARGRVPDTSDPNGSRLDGPKHDQLPVAMEFLVRPFGEALLFEIASAYEAGTKHRR